MLRRASFESQVPDQHSAPQKYDVHLEYAQEGRTDASVSAYSTISVGYDIDIDRQYRFGIRDNPQTEFVITIRFCYSHSKQIYVQISRFSY
jgi:hypothetical protein